MNLFKVYLSCYVVVLSAAITQLLWAWSCQASATQPFAKVIYRSQWSLAFSCALMHMFIVSAVSKVIWWHNVSTFDIIVNSLRVW